MIRTGGLAWLLLCLSLLMALWPVGRLALAGFQPTLEQLLDIRCLPRNVLVRD